MNVMGKRSSPTAKELFAQRLREQRIARNIPTGKKAAEKVGVPEATYRQWERGGTEPSIADLVKIQRGLNVSLDYLIAGIVPGYASPPDFPETSPSKEQKTRRRSA